MTMATRRVLEDIQSMYEVNEVFESFMYDLFTVEVDLSEYN